jgi:hypothetical protein
MLYFLPRGIHNWAQADRLSLAINFYDRGMNFFLPRTHNLHSIDGVVGVEFPAQSYLAAALAKIFGREQISVLFRLVNVLISCTGLLFLFLSCYRVTKDFIFSIVTPLFIFCSPVFIYYTCNYLPDTASASIIFIAFYFVLRYQDKACLKDMVSGIVLLTLAGLIKTSAVIYLLAFIGYIILQKIFRRGFSRRHNLVFVISVLLSVATLGGYFLYNRHLNSKYESWMFLLNTMPFKDWDEVTHFLDNSFKPAWMYEYLVLPQYLLLAVIAATAFPVLIISTEGKKRLVYVCISLIGALLVTYLMGGQLVVHDYYIIVIFLPLVAYWLLVSVIAIYKNILQAQGRRLIRIAMLTSIIIIFFFSDHHIHQRLKPNYKFFESDIPWAEHGDELLKQLNISKTEHILALNEYPPNLALVYFDRRGINISPGTWANISEARTIMNRHNLKIAVCNEQLGNELKDDSLFNKNFIILALKDRKAVFKVKN